MVEQFAVDEAEATADLLGEAAFGGVFEEFCVVMGDVALAVEKEAEDTVLKNSKSSSKIETYK